MYCGVVVVVQEQDSQLFLFSLLSTEDSVTDHTWLKRTSLKSEIQSQKMAAHSVHPGRLGSQWR